MTGPDTIAATAALMPDATFRLVEHAGHTLLLEAPQLFDTVVGFLG